MSTETELKLSAAGVSARQVSAHAAVKRHLLKKHAARYLGNIYFDTPELSLQQHLIGLRLRRDGERWLQTVKTSGGATAGLHQRGEWEMPVAGEALELARFDAKPLRKLFADAKLAQSLAPVFRTDFERTAWDLQFDDGSVVELVLDQGEVKAGRRTEAIAELELELKQGESWHLFALARALADTLPLRILNDSKAARGYRLAGHAAPRCASDAGKLVIAAKASAEQAMIASLHHHLAHLQANEAALRTLPEDPHSVRQALTACEQLQAVLALYAPLLPATSLEGMRADLEWLSAELRQLHGWDAFVGETLGALSHWLPQHRGLDALQRRLGRQRREQWQRLCEALQSARYNHWLLDLGLWLQCRDWRADAGKAARKRLDKRAGRFLGEQIDELQQQVLRKAAQSKPLSGRQRVRLLTGCRTLVCALLLDTAVSGKKASAGRQRHLDALTGLGQTLDALEQTPARLRMLAEIGGTRKAPAADLVTGWLLAEQHCAPLRLAEASADYCRYGLPEAAPGEQ